MGSPSTGNLVIQANKNGDFETYDNVFGVERTFLKVDCTNIHAVKVSHYTFDSSWNNTKLRCALTDAMGHTFVSVEEVTIQLIPGRYWIK